MSEKQVAAGGKVGVGTAVTPLVFAAGDEERYRPQVEFIGQWMTARLDGNGLVVRCMATARYGSRTVTVEVPVPAADFADIERELTEAARNCYDAAAKAAEAAAMQAYMTAVAKSEEV